MPVPLAIVALPAKASGVEPDIDSLEAAISKPFGKGWRLGWSHGTYFLATRPLKDITLDDRKHIGMASKIYIADLKQMYDFTSRRPSERMAVLSALSAEHYTLFALELN